MLSSLLYTTSNKRQAPPNITTTNLLMAPTLMNLPQELRSMILEFTIPLLYSSHPVVDIEIFGVPVDGKDLPSVSQTQPNDLLTRKLNSDYEPSPLKKQFRREISTTRSLVLTCRIWRAQLTSLLYQRHDSFYISDVNALAFFTLRSVPMIRSRIQQIKIGTVSDRAELEALRAGPSRLPNLQFVIVKGCGMRRSTGDGHGLKLANRSLQTVNVVQEACPWLLYAYNYRCGIHPRSAVSRWPDVYMFSEAKIEKELTNDVFSGIRPRTRNVDPPQLGGWMEVDFKTAERRLHPIMAPAPFLVEKEQSRLALAKRSSTSTPEVNPIYSAASRPSASAAPVPLPAHHSHSNHADTTAGGVAKGLLTLVLINLGL